LPETIAVLIGVLVLLGGCTAAASLKNVTSTPSAPSAAAYHGQIRQSRYQLGIDLDFYWYKGMNVPRVVAVDAAYAKSLGANAVSIAFPVYAYGSKAAPGPATPKPAIVGQAVRVARTSRLSTAATRREEPAYLPRPMAPHRSRRVVPLLPGLPAPLCPGRPGRGSLRSVRRNGTVRVRPEPLLDRTGHCSRECLPRPVVLLRELVGRRPTQTGRQRRVASDGHG